MWGVIPAAGNGTRIQPLAFSKELLPVGSRRDVTGIERPRAVSEYLVERMVRGGATRICFVISPGKSDILLYYGGSVAGAHLAYVVQNQANGLCDAIFRALPLLRPDEPVLVGLPDTIWFPEDALAALPDDRLCFLLFPVDRPELFDAVITGEDGRVERIEVKSPERRSGWIWGAFKLPGSVLLDLHTLWLRRDRQDQLHIGTLVNAFIESGGVAYAVRGGTSYVDVGTLNGYREAIHLLGASEGRGHEHAEPARMTGWTEQAIRERVRALGPWFHNMELRGVRTAPDHFLGDYPRVKWVRFADHIPADLTGMTVLDIGCNAGFHSIQMKRRGASRVVGIDFDEDYLTQARFAAEVEELEIEYRKLSVYDVAALRERFDLVLFIGVLYHLRHPLLALDLIHEHVTKDRMIFQSMQRGSQAVLPLKADYDFSETAIFGECGYPKLHFIEENYAHDPTNWWVPNAACSAAMLRSAGFQIEAHPEEEVFVCRRVQRTPAAFGDYGAVYPSRGRAGGEAR